MRSRRPAISFLLLAICAALAFIPASAQALPSSGDATVISGSVSFASGMSDLAVTQITPSAIINWNSFSLGTGESLTLAQPSSSGTTLLRLGGGSPMTFSGSLSSLGGLYIVTEAGFVFDGASISAPLLWLSTGNISDADFLAGNYGSGSVGGSGGDIVLRNGTDISAGSSLSIFAGGAIDLSGSSGGSLTNGSGGGSITIAGSSDRGVIGGDARFLGPVTITVGSSHIPAIPEPGTSAMMLAGLALMLAKATRRHRPRL